MPTDSSIHLALLPV